MACHIAAAPSLPALKPFVRLLHYHENELPARIERILPNGQAHLMINLAEDEFRTYSGSDCQTMQRTSGTVLAGPHGRSTAIDTREQRWLAAVEFKLAGAAAFFRLPMSEVRDQVVPLDDLWRHEDGVLRERLCETPTPAAKLRLLETTLLAHFVPAVTRPIAFAISLLDRGVPLAEVSARTGLLPKTFVRRLCEQAGMTPKRLARVCRLQRVLASVASGPVDWCRIAAEQGYADQAHLIHDFRDLAGTTPAAYHPSSPQRRNHLPLEC